MSLSSLGVVIGMMQIPLVLLVDDTLGSSTGYCTLMSQLIPSSLSKTSLLRYFDNVINNMESWWQVWYNVSSMILVTHASYELWQQVVVVLLSHVTRDRSITT